MFLGRNKRDLIERLISLPRWIKNRTARATSVFFPKNRNSLHCVTQNLGLVVYLLQHTGIFCSTLGTLSPHTGTGHNFHTSFLKVPFREGRVCSPSQRLGIYRTFPRQVLSGFCVTNYKRMELAISPRVWKSPIADSVPTPAEP
ncbi:MAG: hypothetical protein RBG13Loki_4305 [Promethearchaeota archaeon CR_4]|nr:MAG: hypothetical protein RBG13Loki_4305 [Candidatus Lokiarchaeota archaeon CR_4]